MKLALNPLAVIRSHAEEQVTAYFNMLARQSTHTDQEYSLKQKLAHDFLNGGSDAFVDVARVDGRADQTEFALEILDKGNAVLQRALARRTAIMQIRAAATQADIDAIVRKIVPLSA